MKKRTSFILFLLFAQVSTSLGQRLIIESNLPVKSERFIDDLPGQVIFYEGFENAQMPLLPKDWKSFGLESAGFTTGTAGTATGQTNQNGFWNVPLHGIFALTNDDVCNCNKSQDRLESRTFDLQGMAQVLLQFDGYQDGSAGQEVRVEVKKQNTAWVTIYTVPASTNWKTRRLQIPALFLAPGFQFRFVYNDQGSYASGFAVDNIYLFEDQTERFSLEEFFTIDGSLSGSGQLYHSIPLVQARDASLRFGADVSSDASTRKNAYLATSVSGPVTFNDTTSTWFLSSQDHQNLAFDQRNVFTPHLLGSYALNARVLTDSIDEDTSDNSYEAVFNVTDSIYRRTEIPSTNALGVWLQNFGFRYGAVFQVFKSDTLRALNVRIHPSSQAGARFRIKVFSYDTLTSSSFSSSPIVIGSEDIGTSMRVPLNINVSRGKQLFVIEKETGSQRLVIGANSIIEPSPGNVLTREANQAWSHFGYFPLIELVFAVPDSACPGYLQAKQKDQSCVGAADGSIAVKVFDAHLPFSYNWSNGAGNVDSIGALTPGFYSLFVTDAANCIYEKLFEVKAADTMLFNPIIEADSCSLLKGAVDLNIDGGTQPIHFLWNGNPGLELENNLSAGTYIIQATDANGCVADTQLVVPGTAPLGIAFAVTNADCGDSNGLVSVTPFGTGPFTYLWSTGDTASELANCFSGIYQLTITDSIGCTTSARAFVNDINAPVAGASTIVNNQCIDQTVGSISLTVGGGFPPYTYQWSNGANTSSVAGLAGGDYFLTLTDTAGCKSFNAFSVINDAIPLLLDLNERGNYCANENDGALQAIISGGNAPYDLVWSTGSSNLGLENLAPGTYHLTVTDDNGCSLIDSSTISAGGFFTVELDSVFWDTTANFIDEGAIFTQTIGGVLPIAYLWNDSLNGANLLGVPPGFYSLEATDQLGCITNLTVQLGNGPAGVRTDKGNEMQWTIYPNPAFEGNPINVRSSHLMLGIEILDATGRSIDYKSFKQGIQHITLETSHLLAGMYLVRISTKNGADTKRIYLLR